jgi:uncharacterized Zn ribbon protein
MEFTVPAKQWGDMLFEEEHTRRQAVLTMPRSEWIECVNAYLATLSGNGVALISTLQWVVETEAKRAEVAKKESAAVPEQSEEDRNWRVWSDMVEEPWKYGSDIGEWLEMDDELRRGPKRWRVDAHWWGKVREQEVEESAAATKIQALWRGYVDRYTMAPRFICSRCLSHGVCTTQWDEDSSWICAECAVEWKDALRALGKELEAEEEECCDDCGDESSPYRARVGHMWLCPICIHSWSECETCKGSVYMDTRCGCTCKECGDRSERRTGFCSTDCWSAYARQEE